MGWLSQLTRMQWSIKAIFHETSLSKTCQFIAKFPTIFWH